MDYYGGFGPSYDLFSVMFFIIFFLILGTIIVNAIRGVSEWSSNNSQPILDVDCKVVSKRVNVSHNSGHHDANGHYHSGSSSTTYYVTFEFESGDRMELVVGGRDYGMMAENDYGKLKFQGTRFLEFNRKV
ncbi:MAG: DUF2500 domain-containing protein [Peptostreptococcaceae bacterium]